MMTLATVTPINPVAALMASQWTGANPADAAPPRVLAADVAERLARVNAVVRRLRGWGIRVTAIGVWDEPPAVRIERVDHESIGPLLDAAGPRNYRPRHGRSTVARCLLDDVEIQWEERP